MQGRTGPGEFLQRFYIQFTGFPFPLGPLLFRQTFRYEVSFSAFHLPKSGQAVRRSLRQCQAGCLEVLSGSMPVHLHIMGIVTMLCTCEHEAWHSCHPGMQQVRIVPGYLGVIRTGRMHCGNVSGGRMGPWRFLAFVGISASCAPDAWPLCSMCMVRIKGPLNPPSLHPTHPKSLTHRETLSAPELLLTWDATPL